ATSRSGGVSSCFRRRTIIASVSTRMIAPVNSHVTSSEPVDKLAVPDLVYEQLQADLADA
ncbi:MAG: hypothetical protein O2856_17840, partial [Planctomycetota bacterium]|nr:hypothetical protein [Planctomycetota bacterium]